MIQFDYIICFKWVGSTTSKLKSLLQESEVELYVLHSEIRWQKLGSSGGKTFLDFSLVSHKMGSQRSLECTKFSRQMRWNGKSQVMHLRLLLEKCTCNSHFGSTAPFLPCFFQWLDGHSQGPGHEDMFLPDFLRDIGLRMAWPRWSQLLARENCRAPSFAARLESNHPCCQRCSGSRDWQGTWWNGWIDCLVLDIVMIWDDSIGFKWFLYVFVYCCFFMLLDGEGFCDLGWIRALWMDSFSVSSLDIIMLFWHVQHSVAFFWCHVFLGCIWSWKRAVKALMTQCHPTDLFSHLPLPWIFTASHSAWLRFTPLRRSPVLYPKLSMTWMKRSWPQILSSISPSTNIEQLHMTSRQHLDDRWSCQSCYFDFVRYGKAMNPLRHPK